jgi:hypothetical protein
MGFADRKKLYEELETYRKHPVISYVTSTRQNAGGSIATDAVRQFVKQLELFKKKPQEIDLLINSNGGDGLTSWRLITLLREYLGKEGKITCLVPFHAFSAATLMAVGCDEIFLHPWASLGPVDPQITVNNKDGTQQFAYEDVSAYTNFLKEEAGITEQKEKVELLSQLVNQIAPSVIGGAKRASMQSIIMAEKLLKLHMTGSEAQNAEAIAQKLSKNYFSHGHAVTKTEAKELGLKISSDDSEIERIIWDIYTDFEDEMKMCEPFDPNNEYFSAPESAFMLEPPAIVNLPSGLDPQMAQQVFNNIINSSIKNGVSVDYKLLHASIESINHSEIFISKGKIMGTRLPNLNYNIGVIQISSKWEDNTSGV